MDKDPKSYRVPILRLSDIVSDEDSATTEESGATQPQSDIPPASPAPKATAASDEPAAQPRKVVFPPMPDTVPTPTPTPTPAQAPAPKPEQPVQTEAVKPVERVPEPPAIPKPPIVPKPQTEPGPYQPTQDVSLYTTTHAAAPQAISDIPLAPVELRRHIDSNVEYEPSEPTPNAGFIGATRPSVYASEPPVKVHTPPPAAQEPPAEEDHVYNVPIRTETSAGVDVEPETAEPLVVQATLASPGEELPDIWEAASRPAVRQPPTTHGEREMETEAEPPASNVASAALRELAPSSMPVEEFSLSDILHDMEPETAPAQSEAPKPAEQAPTEKPSQQGMNLAALRERMLHKSMEPEQSAPVPSEPPQTDELARSPAADRAASLVRTDLKALEEAHRMLAEEPAIPQAVSRPVLPMVPDTKIEDHPIALEEVVPEQESAPRMPETEHAQAIAEVAHTLHDLRGDLASTGVAHSEPPHPPAQAPESLPAAQAPVAQLPGTDLPQSSPFVRTFRRDMERSIAHKQTSVIQMVAADQTRMGELATVRNAARTGPSTLTLVSLSVSGAFALAGIIIGVLYLLPTSFRSEVEPTVLFTEQNVEFDATDKSARALLSDLASLRDSTSVPKNQLTEVRLYERVTLPGTTEEKKARMSGKKFFTQIESEAPITLTHSVSDDMLLGFLNMDGNQPVLAFTITSYENGLSGMLSWESDVREDLRPLFQTEDAARSEASSTGELSAQKSDGKDGGFEDTVVKNIESRVHKNTKGDADMIWAFPDSATLIITTNEEALEEALSRLSADAK